VPPCRCAEHKRRAIRYLVSPEVHDEESVVPQATRSQREHVAAARYRYALPANPFSRAVSPVSTDVATLAATGLALGWSVAWPPGPINAEMIRRGLSRGFWPAYAVGLGASSADFLWALLITLGAGVVVGLPGVRTVMLATSSVLLLMLSWMFLRGAGRSWRAWRTGQPLPARRALDSTRGGYFLGVGMAFSSPWNVAFWIAVVGNTQSAGGSRSVARS